MVVVGETSDTLPQISPAAAGTILSVLPFFLHTAHADPILKTYDTP